MTDKLKMHISNASPLVHILYVHNSLYPMQSHFCPSSHTVKCDCAAVQSHLTGAWGDESPHKKKEK